MPASPDTKHILITGLPGVGKPTIIKRLAESLRDLHPSGFFTAEIRERGERKGFELRDLSGEGKKLLAHRNHLLKEIER
ncbi:MAG: hypothetical protein HGA78_05275 [Nitrospirales bacterium]|nr:hypothetical protein [Nitrospirales bacterium]